MECSFEEEIDLPGGGYRNTKCIARAMILNTKDPCFGLCYHCAYKQLRVENERLKEEYKGYEQLLKIIEVGCCEGDCDLYEPYEKCAVCIAKGVMNRCGEERDIAIREIERRTKND